MDTNLTMYDFYYVISWTHNGQYGIKNSIDALTTSEWWMGRWWISGLGAMFLGFGAPLPVLAQSGVEAFASADNSIEEVWSVMEGQALSDALSGWARRGGWKLIWEADSDFRLGASGHFTGSFDQAAAALISAFGRTKPRLRASFYEGNKVLRVWMERAEP